MRSLFRSGAAVALAALVMPAALAAQRPVELGIDGGLAFKVNDPTLTSLSIPFQTFRVGFFVGDRVSFEPSLSLDWTKQGSSPSITALGIGASVLHHFAPAGRESQGYVRPMVSLAYLDVGPVSETQFALGAGLGIKLRAANRLYVRLEGSYNHAFEGDTLEAADVITLAAGFSFFTR